MIIVGRPIEGVTLNGLEYILDANNEPIKFKDKLKAYAFLQEAGYSYTHEELENMFEFEEVAQTFNEQFLQLVDEAADYIISFTELRKEVFLNWKNVGFISEDLPYLNEYDFEKDLFTVPTMSFVEDWKYSEYAICKIAIDPNYKVILFGVNLVDSSEEIENTLEAIKYTQPEEIINLASYLQSLSEEEVKLLSIGDLNEKELEAKGVIITHNGEYYEIEHIDNPEEWEADTDLLPAKLNSDDQARVIAETYGLEFKDAEFIYKITNLKE